MLRDKEVWVQLFSERDIFCVFLFFYVIKLLRKVVHRILSIIPK